MKVKAIVFTQEGFTSARGLEFENGLILRTPNVLWGGKEGREKALLQFEQVLQTLKEHGIEIQNE